MGALAKGFLRKVSGNSAESSRKFANILLRQARVQKFCGNLHKFHGN